VLYNLTHLDLSDNNVHTLSPVFWMTQKAFWKFFYWITTKYVTM
jgi:hypothetical protein